MDNPNSKHDFFNPFEGRDPDIVWDEIERMMVPTTREELAKRIQQARDAMNGDVNPETEPTDKTE